MTDAVVIVHPEWGLFIGVSMGFAFWTNLECADQTCVAVMPSEADARAFLARWRNSPDPDLFTYHPVQVSQHFATIEELDAAGLSEWTVPLKAARMGEAQGNA